MNLGAPVLESLEQMKIFSGDREAVRNQAVAFALEFLAEHLV